MSDLAQQAEPAIKDLLNSDEGALFTTLGIRALAMQGDTALGSSFAPGVTHDESMMGPLTEVRKYGERIFGRVNAEAYKLICGTDPEDAEDRKKLLDVFNLGGDRIAAIIAGLLVAQLGLAPAVAAVVAVIIFKRFLAKDAYQASCDFWKSKLPKS